MTHTAWTLRPGLDLPLSRPRIIAVLNITPDSFSDGGPLMDPGAARDAAARAIAEGADLLDVGGESTRPGAAPVSEAEELRRVLPAIRAVRTLPGPHIPITIDTTKAAVALAALDAGADAVNDVSALTHDPAMLPLVARRACGVILMHRLAPPRDDRYSDQYAAPPLTGDAVASVIAYLQSRADAALHAGVPRSSIVLDPGLGFGKSVEQNLDLIRRTPELTVLGFPILSALSRKSFVGRVGLGRDSDPSERLPATLALSVLHLTAGARLFRVHDVAAHRQALDAAWAAMPQ